MRHGKVLRRLSRKTGERTALLRNLSQALVEHGRIRTTTAKAKVLKPYIEKMVTRLKDPTVHNLRRAHQVLSHRPTVLKIAQDISPKFKERPGGYTRIMKLSTARVGDAADMALIEWVDESLVRYYVEEEVKKAALAEAKAASKKKVAKKPTATKKKTTKKSTDK